MSTSSTARSKALLAALVVAGIIDLAFLNLHAAPRYLAELKGSDGDDVIASAAASARSPASPSDPEPALAAAPPVAREIEAPSEPPAKGTAEPEAEEPEPEPEPTADAMAAAPEPPRGPPAATGGEPPVIANLNFGSGSSALGQRSRQLLFEVAKHMRATRGQKVLLQGHADEQGSATVNAALSVQRARAAAAHLIELGVSQQHIQITGMGESMPADQGDSPQSLARNRRVVVIWQ